jgi:hypothetical protein
MAFYQQGIGKLVLRYDRFLILSGDYVEKYSGSYKTTHVLFFSEVEIIIQNI